MIKILKKQFPVNLISSALVFCHFPQIKQTIQKSFTQSWTGGVKLKYLWYKTYKKYFKTVPNDYVYTINTYGKKIYRYW